MVDKPLMSIIIAVYNGQANIESVINSIINQTYENLELIIIDGGSTDRTLDIIKKYDHAIDYWVSESDAGISDAFNKGIKVARGEYINFQGDGDGFYSIDSLEKIVQGVNSKDDIFITGRIQRVSKDGIEMYVSKLMPKFHKESLLFRMSMPHQALFTSTKYFEKYGLFDVKNTYCMDYEHLLRSYKNFPKVVTKDVIVAKWRADGLGNDRDLEIFKEYHKIKVNNKIATYPTLVAINLWTLFKYYIKKMIK
jgi:glycosyltransferase involved in cell wall biosynthesis